MFPISWYIYVLYFAAITFILVKKTSKEDDESNLWDRSWPLLLAITLVPISFLYFSNNTSQFNPLIILALTLPVTFISCYEIITILKEVYYDDDEEEEDEDSDEPSSSVDIHKLTIAPFVKNNNIVDLDYYGKPVDPIERGKAFVSLLSPLSDEKTALKSLELLSGNDQDNDDSDSGYHLLGVVMLWIMLAPSTYFAYSVSINTFRSLGWF